MSSACSKGEISALGIEIGKVYTLSEIQSSVVGAHAAFLGPHSFSYENVKMKVKVGGRSKDIYFKMLGEGGFDEVSYVVSPEYKGW